jgi:hypothetical protein
MKGDLCSTFFFALIISPVIAAAANKIPDAAIFTYVDEITIVAAPDTFDLAIPTILEGLSSLGLRLSKQKCWVWLHSPAKMIPPSLSTSPIPKDEDIRALSTPSIFSTMS